MLKDVKWSEERSYRTCSENEPIKFYLECLCNSKSLDLLLGYFSSAAINILSLGFATFLFNGGVLRLIINNVLSHEDKQAIKRGQEGLFKKELIDLNNIKLLKDSLDDYGKQFFHCLSWLIANDRIQFKIIKPIGGQGIAHYKSGTFHDGNDYVGFKASCNFTAFGLLENLEELDAFLSWENSRSSKMISCQKREFENIFSGNSNIVEYLSVDEVTEIIHNEFGNFTIHELLINEKELIERKKSAIKSKSTVKAFNELSQQLNKISRTPKFPYPSGARDYQIAAFEKWRVNGGKGIFAMATGTGKTITSLNCLLNEYVSTETYKAVILVPTIALLEQWKKECLKFNFRNIIVVSSKYDWLGDISFFSTASKLIDTSYIIIVTYASFVKPKFQSIFATLPQDTLLIADEVHNMGAKSVSALLPKITLEKRIGLSATPERIYDTESNRSIQDFFHDRPPYIFSYPMREAIYGNPPALCKYTYFPHVVTLSENELNEYIKISKQLLKFHDSKTGKFKDCQELEMLLLKRKRIIHKAENKKVIFRSIINEEFKKQQRLRYTLIYVPEGLEPDYSTIDEYFEDEDELHLIDEYTKIVSNTDSSIMVMQYTSKSQSREKILQDFANGKVHVLTSMKCLDEGVDIPRSEFAIFCASTGNPRQFIQRRGRVLRIHKDKVHAVIHDLIVVPVISNDSKYYEMERSLVRNELKRVVDFSDLSMNKIDTYEILKETLEFYNLNLYDF